MVQLAENRIRILYVVENRSFGGGERGFGQLSSNLNRNRFQPFFAGHPGGKLEEVIRQTGIPFFPVDMSHKVNLKTIGNLSQLISKHRIHIVHSMGARADFFARMACRKNPSAAVVCTVAMLVEGFDVGFPRKAVYKMADRYSAKYVTQYVTVSKALKEILVKERNIPADKISVIYNGVELDQYNPNLQISDEIRQSLKISDDYPIVGTIGRLVYQKGLTYFLEAAQYVYSEKQCVRFVIVGDGPEKVHLTRLANDLGISHLCTFAGLRFDIAALLSTFNVFVLSSILEGLPRVVIEAMAMARPIVATDINGVREELIHDKTGLLVPPADPKGLADAILKILNDRNRAERMGKEARKNAERMFDLKRTLANVEKLYEAIFNSTSHK
jgi:glycosyltransferase involved in cell wall biosynthesis